jgi:hypothetical protein
LFDGEHSQYHSRLDRARTANNARRGTDSLPSPKTGELSGGRFSMEPQSPGTPVMAKAASTGALATATVLLPADEPNTGARWAYSEAQQRLAVVDSQQLLMIIDRTGCLEYRVQLPPEGHTIFIGWEPGGSVLAAVQKLGGAFLWFPSKPENVQQWEGMQFSTKVLKGSLLKRNSHFDACFASWSSAGKLVLGAPPGCLGATCCVTGHALLPPRSPVHCLMCPPPSPAYCRGRARRSAPAPRARARRATSPGGGCLHLSALPPAT